MCEIKEEKNYCVYIHTSPSNKAYIGITRQNIEDRWGNGGSHYKRNKHFWSAIEKYGWDNFEHFILFDGLTKEEACKIEILLIALFENQNPSLGYNISPGGNLGFTGCKLSDEAKQKLSDAKKGLFVGDKNPMYGISPKERMDDATYDIWKKKLITFTTSDEFKQQCRERNIGKKYSEEVNKRKGKRGSDHPMYGKHHSEETKQKLRESNTGKVQSEETRKKISEAMTGKNNPFYGKTHSEESKVKMSKSRKKTAVVCIELGKFFESVTLAAKFIGQSGSGNIHICLKDKNKTCGGYHWRYATKEEIENAKNISI